MPNGFCMVAVKNGRTVFIMTINVVDLLQEVNAVADLDISDSVKAFDYMGETIAFDGDVHVLAKIFRVQSKYYKITGIVRARLILQCGRCMKNYKFDTEFPVELHFTSKQKAIDDDVDYYYTDGDTVELDEAIQTNVIMNIPAQRLCSENCKGLCPVCGADLDTGCCCCSRGENNDKAVDARLAVLKDFFDK